METFTLKELAETGKELAQSYVRGDDPCLGIPREEICLVSKDFAYWKPYFPLYVSKVIPKK